MFPLNSCVETLTRPDSGDSKMKKTQSRPQVAHSPMRGQIIFRREFICRGVGGGAGSEGAQSLGRLTMWELRGA